MLRYWRPDHRRYNDAKSKIEMRLQEETRADGDCRFRRYEIPVLTDI